MQQRSSADRDWAQRWHRSLLHVLGSDGLLGFLIILGIALFMRAYLANRALWGDEAALALNFRRPLWPLLSQPLDYHQAAPPGFLLIEWLMRRLWGESSYVLRLLPLFSASAGLVLAALVGRQLLAAPAVPFLLLFLISNPYLNTYAVDVKQYASDLFWTLLLYWLIIRWESLPLTKQRTLLLALLGTLVILFSHPAVLVLAGLGSLLGLRALRQKEWVRLKWLGVMGGIWALVFGAYYWFGLRGATSNDYLLHYWDSGFMPTSWSHWSEPLLWLWGCLERYLSNPVFLRVGPLSYLIPALGLLALSLKRPKAVAYIFAPLPFFLLASALQRYPLALRMLLFSLPLFGLSLATGLYVLIDAQPPLGYAVALIVLAALLWPSVSETLDRVRTPMRREELPAVLEYVLAQRRPDDALYIYYACEHPLLFYSPQLGLSPEDYILGNCYREEPARYVEDLRRYHRDQRVWLVFSHNYIGSVDERDLFLALMDARGQRLDEYHAPGASAHLYRVERPLTEEALDAALREAAR